MSKASLELGGGNWGTKNGNLLGYAKGSEAGRFVPREFSFTRGSDISATRINSSGLIEKYRENLLLQSNQFDTAWTTSAVSLTSGQSGYDGTNNAWLLTKTTIFSNIKQSLNQSNVCTFSVYAKANTYSWLLLHIEDSAGDAVVSFDLDPNTIGNRIGSQIQNIYASIESVGNGWYRCSITALKNATEFRIYPNESNGYSGAAGSIYIQDAQLEQGLVATSYLESGATKATSGVADNEPRIDYAGGTASLLLEPSRTNLIEYSEGILSLSGSATAEYDFTQESPTGLRDGVAFISNIQDSEGDRIQYQGDIVGGNTYTGSMYIKGTSGKSIKYYIKRQGGTYVASVAQTITFDGTWQRIHSTFTSLADNTGARIILLNDSNVNADSCYIWGGQLEQGSYATSYIPTYGTSVTRNADGELYKDLAANNFIGDTFSIFFEIDNVNYGTANSNFNYLNSSIGGSAMYVYGSTLGIHTTTGDDYSTFLQGFTNPKGGKFLAVYNGSNVKIYKDGSLYRTISNPSARWDNVTIYRLRMYSATATSSYKSLMIFPTALSDDECITLTT